MEDDAADPFYDGLREKEAASSITSKCLDPIKGTLYIIEG